MPSGGSRSGPSSTCAAGNGRPPSRPPRATLRLHARDLITKRLAPAEPYHDGKQTPYRGHPVFVAQHATATCCRSCLLRWHQIPKGRELTREERGYVVDVICRWIEREVANPPRS